MNQELIKFTPIIVILFVISLLFYIFSSYYKTTWAKNLIDSRENNRSFAIKLSQDLRNKAGFIVSKSNFDPIVPNTLLRVLLQTVDGKISSYLYDKNLIINSNSSENIIDIRDIVDYLPISKDDNKYTVYLQ